MAVVNLAYPERGSVKIEKIKYPDGQVSVKVPEGYMIPDHVWIQSRMNDYEDLAYILSLTDALHYIGKECSLFVTCFLGQRSDRRFFDNQSFDLKIICEVINSQYFKKVRVLHPHSDVLPALLNNCEVITSKAYVELTIQDIEKSSQDMVILVSPDAGAYKQVYKYGEEFGRTTITGNKSRDLLSNDIVLDIHGNVSGRTCLVVDDYCDGGRTFIGLAQKLRELGASDVYLYVTHGLFSNGYQELAAHVTGIYCTNSISDIKDKGTWLKQFNVI